MLRIQEIIIGVQFKYIGKVHFQIHEYCLQLQLVYRFWYIIPQDSKYK